MATHQCCCDEPNVQGTEGKDLEYIFNMFKSTFWLEYIYMISFSFSDPCHGINFDQNPFF
jgi:hypothetical protein